MGRNRSFHHLFAIVVAALVLAACGGRSDNDGDGIEVTISGRITFDRPPFKTQVGGGLDLDNPTESPARGIVVELIDATSQAILASTVTSSTGEYSLTGPANRRVFVRAKAQMLRTGAAPTWNFRVLNNTNRDALYALDSEVFDTGTESSTRNLHAPTGWGTTSYTGTRAAAPFAILDTVYRAQQLILNVEPNAVFPPLDLFWSPSNRPTLGVFCPDTGDIGTTFYQSEGALDQCATPAELPAGIYILGDFGGGIGDTDEFDQHVIAHEFGHYFENRFSRSDSMGGGHVNGDRLDLRVAFGEGWSNAYAAMALEDPEYRDSQGIEFDFGFNLEVDNTSGPGSEGWYSETSISEILWDLFDGPNEPHDAIELGFAPLYAVMSGPQVRTEALTSIFTFAAALRAANPAHAAAIDDLLRGEDIAVTDEFASDETNHGGDPEVLPLYPELIEGAPTLVCVHGRIGALDNNKLGNRKFFRFYNPARRLVTIDVIGTPAGVDTIAARDPNVFVYRRGNIVAAGTIDRSPRETLDQITLDEGLHIIEVYDFDLPSVPSTKRCMTLSATGT